MAKAISRLKYIARFFFSNAYSPTINATNPKIKDIGHSSLFFSIGNVCVFSILTFKY